VVGIASDGAAIVALGYRGKVWLSSDGENWAEKREATDTQFVDLIWAA